MKITIDTADRLLIIEEEGGERLLPLYSKEAFETISDIWVKVGWAQKYSYTFSWLGRPIIQLPEDMVRIQEVIFAVKPDVIVETGVAHGGSLIYYASLCALLGKGRVIGIDIEIRPQNRQAIEAHELVDRIALIEGSSTDPATVASVKARIAPGETVLVILDSCHTKEHVLNELNAYHALVTPGSYIVATDGSMKDFYDAPRGDPDWAWDNPVSAVAEFIKHRPEFQSVEPAWAFNESELNRRVTHWPQAFLKKV